MDYTEKDGICEVCGEEATFEKICSACEMLEGQCNCKPIEKVNGNTKSV